MTDGFVRGELNLRNRFNEKPRLGQGFTVLLLSFFCLMGFGIGDISYTMLLQSELGGRQSEEISLSRELCSFLCGIDPFDPAGVLQKGLPYSITAGRNAATSSSYPIEELPAESPLHLEKPALEEELAKKPVEVAIYHTHNAETYIPLDKKSKVQGKNGGITLVGEEIIKTLAENGVRGVQDLTIHDHPNFPRSYIESKKTASRLLNEHPELKVLIDLHRDAGIPKKQTTTVNGQESALIMFVIGNGQGIPNPHWRENLAFARKVANRLEEKYPGIVKAVRIKNGCYNQNLSPKAILVEIGSDKNTLEEALLAGRCLGEVLAEIIQE